MGIGLSEEHRALQDAVRGWAARHVPSDVVRASVEAKTETRPAFWTDLAAQGLLGVHLPEQYGGGGEGLLALAVVAEQLGRTLVPGPFLPTVLASAVLHDAGHTTHLAGLADGSVLGALAPGRGELTLTAADGAAWTLDGASAPVPCGAVADVFVLPACVGNTMRWVVVSREAVEVDELPSYDPTRRLARVGARSVRVSDADVLEVEPTRVLDLAAVLVAAEACGIADWCVATASEYAKVREQFGRPIGQFQGVKHRCARMLVRAEQARAAAWDAARAADEHDEPAEQFQLAAAVAGVLAPDAAFGTAKDCVQVLGGIGFTWEHDAGFYLRRAQSLRLLLGSTTSWQQRVARLTLGGVRRELGVDLPPEAEAIRAAIRDELAPARQLSAGDRGGYLAERGYTAPHLPTPWGKSADAITQLVIAEELRAAELEPVDMVIGGWVVPTIIEHGNAEQQQRFLPASLRGEIVWCQLFSEPGAGSDLAALSTRAEKVPRGWQLTGQKVWTSGARDAHWGICLARTDAEVPKHKGLSYFLVDMSSPGITIRPLRELTGDALFNEVFLDDVFVPDSLVVGEVHDGWRLARTTLANERVAMATSRLGKSVERAVDLLQGTSPACDQAAVGRAVALATICSLLGVRTVLRSLGGHGPGAESSVAKLLGVRSRQDSADLVLRLHGPAAALGGGAGEAGEAVRADAWEALNTRCLSIAGGTTQILRNVAAERILGLPRG
ncbi:MAG TPA: acyl-CoA dehydrogenase [Jatrophihabitantaceae bacterium]|nr:acyl-CoA dehydrogenase [Jatrophihabitantaceae bacterium]